MDQQLIIFARAPHMGRVKRRLAAEVGDVRATQAYRQILTSVTRPLINDTRWSTSLAITPDPTHRPTWAWPAEANTIPQGRGDLGDRMSRAAAAVRSGPVVIVGTDIPDIQPHHAAEAFKALRTHDCVVGPAQDGGYWLIGLRRMGNFRDLFRNVRWSTSHALDDTLSNLPLDTTIAYLEVLEDIDDAGALNRWEKRR